MRKPLAAYSGDERRRIAALARRSAKSEVSLILGGGFSLVMIVLFLLGQWTFLPVAMATGIRPTVVWAGMAFGIAAIWAFLHHRQVAPRIEEARLLNAAFLHDHQMQVQRDNRKRAREDQ